MFIASEVNKQGGNSGLTFVSLDIDGRNVVNMSYAAAQNLALSSRIPMELYFSVRAKLRLSRSVGPRR